MVAASSEKKEEDPNAKVSTLVRAWLVEGAWLTMVVHFEQKSYLHIYLPTFVQ